MFLRLTEPRSGGNGKMREAPMTMPTHSFEIWSLELLWCLDVGAWSFHSVELDWPHQPSRRCLAVLKNCSTASPLLLLSAD